MRWVDLRKEVDSALSFAFVCLLLNNELTRGWQYVHFYLLDVSRRRLLSRVWWPSSGA